MSIHKVMQKHDKQTIAEFECTEMSSTFTDIICTANGGVTTWKAIYTILKDEKAEVMEVKATIDEAKPSDLQF